MKKWLRILTLVVLAFLVLGNPSESQFQDRLVADYGFNHGGMSLSLEDLKKMGSSQYQSYLLFSKFHYSFGNIGVHYLGVGFMTFYLGNHQAQNNHKPTNDKRS